MRPKMLVELSKFNDIAKGVSWRNYQGFLATLLSSIDSPQASSYSELVKQGRWTELVEKADGDVCTEYSTPAQHRLNHQIASVIRKYPFPEGLIKVDPEAKALEKFLASEHLCKRVNQRFACYRKVRSPHELALNTARTWIQYVLGDLKLSDIWSGCDFGAGASLGIHGHATNSARKLLSKSWSVTPGAYYYAMAALKEDDHIMELLSEHTESGYYSIDPCAFNKAFGEKARIVTNNKIAFVPKTVMVHRTIAVEPLLNGFIQKGVDSFMRKRLKRVGINLSDQTVNQRLAREGSLNHKSSEAWATIDLSSASDCISIELCRFLLPPDWFDFLNSVRSHDYELKGKVFPYHKFVSMGNGFCFPLETLIFASLCHAACKLTSSEPDFQVYGDDILIRKRVFPTLLQLLGVCGFKVNPKKTFFNGPFRESCGADWFEGEDVRPIMLDYTFDSLENILKFCNICRSKDTWECIFSESLHFLESLIPPNLKLVRPYKGEPDSALEVPWDVFMASPFSRWNRKLQCWDWVEVIHTAVRDNPVRSVAGYHIALMRGALTGVKSSCPFTERFTSRTKLRRRSYGGGWSLYLPGSIPGGIFPSLPLLPT